MLNGGMPPLNELNIAPFLPEWRRAFGEMPPLGHILRQSSSACWARFHALPNSKRLARTSGEKTIILSRANTLVTACFGARQPIWLIVPRYTGCASADEDIVVQMRMQKAFTWVDEREAREDQIGITFFVKRLFWTPNSLDDLFEQIADGNERAVLFAERDQVAFAPYDGGFDILSSQPAKVNYLEEEYAAWMSLRADRL
ncbi:MAG: hypothetical protein JKX69_00695 [Rhodobacteraceae bacterium]|nr:hypothetical protein [Paracoccaceae bacterium]